MIAWSEPRRITNINDNFSYSLISFIKANKDLQQQQWRLNFLSNPGHITPMSIIYQNRSLTSKNHKYLSFSFLSFLSEKSISSHISLWFFKTLKMSTLQSMSLDQLSEFACHMTWFILFNKFTIGINGRLVDSKPTKSFCSFTWRLIGAYRAPYSLVLLTLLYIARLRTKFPSLVTQNNTDKSERWIFMTALIIACKYLDDGCIKNTTWAKALKIPIAEINRMEREFLVAIDYGLFVSEVSFAQWKSDLEAIYNSRNCDVLLCVPRPNLQYSLDLQRKRKYGDAFNYLYECKMLVSIPKRRKLDDESITAPKVMISRNHYEGGVQQSHNPWRPIFILNFFCVLFLSI